MQLRLDEIRSKMPKFICLNDDMNKTSDPPAATLKALRDFYLSYFPAACPFELQEGQRNQFMYVEQWREQQRQAKSVFGWMAPAEPVNAEAGAASASVSSGVPRVLVWLCLLVVSLLLAWLVVPLTPCGARCKRWARSARGHPRSS